MMFEEPANPQIDAEASAIILNQETVSAPSAFITSQNVDEWIEQLKCCRLLSEANVQLLCDKVTLNEPLPGLSIDQPIDADNFFECLSSQFFGCIHNLAAQTFILMAFMFPSCWC